MKFLNSMTLQVFHDLYESWNKLLIISLLRFYSPIWSVPFSLYPLVNLTPLTSNSVHIQSDFDVQLDPQRVVFCSVAHNPMGHFTTFTQSRIPDHRGNSPPHWSKPFSTRLFYTYNSLTSNSLHVQRDLDVHRSKFSHKIAKHVREC